MSPRHNLQTGGYSSNMTSHQIPVRIHETQQNYNGHIVGSTLNHLHSNTALDTIDSRSFIQERIERLYGPRALAAGFIKRTPTSQDKMGNTVKRSSRTEGRIIPIQLEYDDDNVDNTKSSNVQGMPSVFRHLRPEFRHQLPVKPAVGSGIKSPPSNGNGHVSVLEDIESPQSRPAASEVPTPPHNNSTSNNISNNKNNLSRSDSNKINVSEVSSHKITPDSDDTTMVTPDVASMTVSSDSSGDVTPHDGCCSSLLPSNKVEPAPPVDTAVTTLQTTSVKQPTGQVKDGHYFLKVVADTVSQLNSEADELEASLNAHTGSVSDEVRGRVFAATGKTRLLISQKVKQFTGLCHKNIAGQQGTDEFPTTPSDLAGFWDMVSLQVEDVKKALANCRDIRANNWAELPTVDTVDTASKPVTASKPRRSKPVPSAASKAKDEARKKAMEERRKAMREAMKAKKAEAAKSGENQVEIFVPE